MKTDHRIRLILIFVAWIACSGDLFAQSPDLINRYSQALIHYEQGRIDSTYQILVSCINSKQAMRSVSRETRGMVYKLAAEAAILLGSFDEAADHTRKFRSIQPYYTIRDDDLPEFKALMKDTRIYPKNIISLAVIGPNTKPEMVRNLSPFIPGGEYDECSDNNRVGIQYKRFLNPDISLGIGMHYGLVIEADFDGSKLPLKGWWSYPLNIPAIEWPFICNYYLHGSDNVKLYFETGFSLLKIVNPLKEYRRAFTIERSEHFGKYYSYSSISPEDADPVISVAYFFETPLDYKFIIGIGGLLRYKNFWLEGGFRYFPRLVKNDPFEEVIVFDDIPEDDPLYYYDDIFLVRIKNHFQAVLTFGINLNYGAR